MAALGAAVLVLHLAAAGLVLLGSAAGRPGGVLVLGLVVTAYLAGVKHSYDWDHLAAIDNSTRKFVAEGSRPVSVGFAFSLGHSSVVTLAGLLLVAGARAVTGALQEGTGANRALGLIGAGVSGVYLLAMGLLSASAAWHILRILQRATAGARVTESDLAARGAVARLIGRPLAAVRRPRHVFFIGFLFGLGFDTASTVALLILTVSASASGVSPLALMAMPLAFTAAMTLCDSVNGVAMMRLYAAALREPLRRLRFNLAVTALSAASALVVSVITLGGWLRELLGLTDPVTAWLSVIDLGDAGLLLAGAFMAVWLLWRVLRARDAEPTSDGVVDPRAPGR
jgi:high-affinity nickel-transport protein